MHTFFDSILKCAVTRTVGWVRIRIGKTVRIRPDLSNCPGFKAYTRIKQLLAFFVRFPCY